MLFVKVGICRLDCLFLTNLANLNYKKKPRRKFRFSNLYLFLERDFEDLHLQVL